MQNQSVPFFSENRTFTDEAPFFPEKGLWKHIPDARLSFMHEHNFLEIGFMEKGAGLFNVDGDVYHVQEPCCSILYAGMLHSAQSDRENPSEWYFLYIDAGKVLRHLDETSLKSLKAFHYPQYSFPAVLTRREYPEIFSLVKMIEEEATAHKERCNEVAEGLLFSLLILHGRLMVQKTEEPRDNGETFRKISKAIDFIHNNYMESIVVEQLADMCYISQPTLRRSFLEFTGCAPLEYVHKVRIHNAAVMLLSSERSVLDIAGSTGYTTLSSFNRQFFKHFGMSPREWKKSEKKKQPVGGN